MITQVITCNIQKVKWLSYQNYKNILEDYRTNFLKYVGRSFNDKTSFNEKYTTARMRFNLYYPSFTDFCTDYALDLDHVS